MRATRSARFYLALVLVPFPSVVKVLAYRHLMRYSVGRRVHIGFSLVDAARASIADGVTIGHGNAIISVKELAIGAESRIGSLNVIRGGTVTIGSRTEILRLNEFNAIEFPPEMHVEPKLVIGDFTSITAGHKIDFSGSVTLGREVIVAGRNSSFWTHLRGQTSPITIGDVVYVGSEVRMGPGVSIPPRSVVGMGAVVVKPMDEYPGHVFAGVPARPIRAVSEKDDHLLFNRPPRAETNSGG